MAGEVMYLDIGSLPDVEFVRLLNGGYAISPDGRTVAMIGVKGNTRRLFIRPLGRPEAKELPETVGVNSVTFSPDGKSVAGISSGGELVRISIADQQRTSIATGADVASVLAWSPEGLVFTRGGGLWVIPAAGEARALTTLDAARREVLHGSSIVAARRSAWCSLRA